MSSFGSLAILVFSLNSTNLLKGCWHGVWLWWTIFPVACAAGGIVVPGVLFWRRSRHVKRVATPTTSSSQSSRGFVAKNTAALALAR